MCEEATCQWIGNGFLHCSKVSSVGKHKLANFQSFDKNVCTFLILVEPIAGIMK